jgi:holo-[acyl-carrier protein] synthase
VIVGIGTDLLSRQRIADSWERFGDRFASRILTESERLRMNAGARPADVLAKCFAAKEAVAKALGTGMSEGVSWQHIELLRAPSGQPSIRLHEAALARLDALGGHHVHISLSDEQDYVLAFAVLAS